jgi:YgiT-type zinc finger domain-containing protein
MICDVCGKKTARVHRTTHAYGRGRSLYFVENIPEVTCRSCGENYITAKTLKELDRIHRDWRKLAAKRVVRVARFGGAA